MDRNNWKYLLLLICALIIGAQTGDNYDDCEYQTYGAGAVAGAVAGAGELGGTQYSVISTGILFFFWLRNIGRA